MVKTFINIIKSSYSSVEWNDWQDMKLEVFEDSKLLTFSLIYTYILIKTEIGSWHIECSICTKQRA